jgi:hypothetical protein
VSVTSLYLSDKCQKLAIAHQIFPSDGNADGIAPWPIISAPLPIRSAADLRDWPILGSGRNGRAIVMTGST